MPPPPLPISLSPHVLVLTSPDLDQLLSETRKLPPLHQLLQSFSPLQQVTTRTTGLTSVTIPNFNIRFSALGDIEDACKEDEEARAERTMDWIGGRIAQQAAAWLEDPRMVEHERWWTELRACVEGERAPVRGEGWNHPVALILATSTLAPNPLQAITSLHARTLELPPWVEQFIFKYTLIVHPTPSNLDPNEAVALLNAVKKQFGLNTHLLQLPSLHDKTRFDVPIPLPQLPSMLSRSNQKPSFAHSVSLIMSELDAQNTSRFVREFVTMALIPWMERCVAEWNDVFTNTRRISTRIFGSTARRFFGSSSISSPAGTPSPLSSPPVTSPATGVSPAPFGSGSQVGSLPPHRRLAEFATTLGDYKLATAVWDVLRKETPPSSYARALSDGSDVLPLVLAGGSALSQHANAALAALGVGGSPGAAAQVRALVYAVRWEVGVHDFHNERSNGERWLASAAGTVEEPTSALLLGRAASVSVRKGATRRAALWYAMAARRLEKSGIKSLTIHFFEQANEARGFQKESLLSPSFFDIEGPAATNSTNPGSIDGVQAFLNHALGRLKYSSGNTQEAVALFSGLLRPPAVVSPLSIVSENDSPEFMDLDTSKMYLDDFKDALEHYISTHPSPAGLSEFGLPINFACPALTRLRLPSDDIHSDGSLLGLDGYWASFCRSRGEKGTRLDVSRTAIVNEPFWLNVAFRNPLNTEITLAGVTVSVAGKNGADLVDPSSVEAETLALITLPPKGQVTVSLKITARNATSLSFTSLSYTFLSLLPCTESLATRGRRLNDTPTQRQSVMYGPDVLIQIDVQESGARLQSRFIAPFEMHDDTGEEKHQEEISVVDGEIRKEALIIKNVGDRKVEDIWLVLPPDGSVWIGEEDAESPDGMRQTLEAPKPHRLAGSLEAGAALDVPVIMRHTGDGATTINVLVVFRENDSVEQYAVTRARRCAWVQPIILLNAVVRAAAASSSSLYSLMIEIENIGGSNDLCINQISAISSTWRLTQTAAILHGSQRLPLRQISRQVINVDLVSNLGVQKASLPLEHLADALAAIVEGKTVESLWPPESGSLHCSVSASNGPILPNAHKHFVYSSRRTSLTRLIATDFASIPPTDYPHIFPPYTPLDMDIAVSWSIPASSASSNGQSRIGLISLADAGDLLALGARDGALKNVLHMAEKGSKKGRIMYAETKREREMLLEAIRNCRWNEERCPISLSSAGPVGGVVHDFGNGPCVVPLSFIARNESTTSSVKVTLRLRQPPLRSGTAVIRYVGSLTKRGAVPPGERIEITAKASTLSPGIFELFSWELTAEVGIEQDGQWIEQARYVETDAGGPLEVEVVASPEPLLI